jgi:hypothetical protein
MLEQIFENRQGLMQANSITRHRGHWPAARLQDAKIENEEIKPGDRPKDQIVEINPQDLLEQEIIEIEEQDLIEEE